MYLNEEKSTDMKHNKDRAVLAAGLVALALVAGACAEAAGPNESTVDNGYEAVQYTPTSTTTSRTTSAKAVASEPDYLTVLEAIDIVGNGGSIQPGDVKATTDMDDIFIAYLDDNGISLSEDKALRSAVTACSFLMQGGDVQELWAEVADDPYSPDIIPGVDNVSELPTLMGAAVGAYCPELD